MGIIRRVAAVLLLLLAGLFVFVAGIAKSGDALVGTPNQAVDTALSIISTTEGSNAIGLLLVTNLQKDASPDVAPVFAAHKDALAAAIAATVRDPQTQEIARDIAMKFITAKVTHQAAIIDTSPLLFRITGAMHAVDSRIPAHPTDLSSLAITVKADGESGNPLDAFGTAMWGFLIAAFGLAFVVARFIMRRRTFQYLGFGLALGIPTLFLALVSTRLSSSVQDIDITDPYARVLIDRVVLRVETGLQQTTLLFLVLIGIVLATWAGFYILRARMNATSTATPVQFTEDSKTPEPQLADQSDSGVLAE